MTTSLLRIDPPLLMSSVFRANEGSAVAKNVQKAALNVKFEFAGAKLTFVCFQRPGAFEQRILFALISAATDDFLDLDADATTDLGKDLWSKLVAKDAAKHDRAIVVTTTCRQLLSALGLTDGVENYAHLKDAFFVLSNVVCRVQKDGYDWSMNLFSYSAAPDGSIKVALNGRLAAAIVGGQFAGVCMKSYLSLSSDFEQLLYAYLCSYVPAKSSRKIRLDALCEKIYSNSDVSDDAVRQRRVRIKSALSKICSTLGAWHIVIAGRGANAVAEIKRFRL